MELTSRELSATTNLVDREFGILPMGTMSLEITNRQLSQTRTQMTKK